MLHRWDWDLDARCLAADGLDTRIDAIGYDERDTLTLYGSAATAVRMIATAWSIGMGRSPTPEQIASHIEDEEKLAWLVENATAQRGDNPEEREAIKQLGTWWRQQWRTNENERKPASARLGWRRKTQILWLIQKAIEKRRASTRVALEQLERGTRKRAEWAAARGIEDRDDTRSAEAGFAEHFVALIEAGTRNRENEPVTLGTPGVLGTACAQREPPPEEDDATAPVNGRDRNGGTSRRRGQA